MRLQFAEKVEKPSLSHVMIYRMMSFLLKLAVIAIIA
jgi:hypothetical protein